MFAKDNSEMGLGAGGQFEEQWLRFPLSYYFLTMQRHKDFADDQILPRYGSIMPPIAYLDRSHSY
jgi:hypothetical protein